MASVAAPRSRFGGRVSVVVGTRSAVFAPLARLGLIIVDEERDSSYSRRPRPALPRPRCGGHAGRLESCPVGAGLGRPGHGVHRQCHAQ